MPTVRLRQIAAVFIALSVAHGVSSARTPDKEDWDAARKASCPELIDAYKATSAAERKVAAALKDSKDGTVAANVLGVASLALVGFGFFTWDDNSSAEENLADLRHDLTIITTVASEKKCELPVLEGSKK